MQGCTSVEVDAVDVHVRMSLCHIVAPVAITETQVEHLSSTASSRTLSQLGFVEALHCEVMNDVVDDVADMFFQLLKSISAVKWRLFSKTYIIDWERINQFSGVSIEATVLCNRSKQRLSRLSRVNKPVDVEALISASGLEWCLQKGVCDI